VFTSVTGDKVKALISLPSHAVAGLILTSEPQHADFLEKSVDSATKGIIHAKPRDYMKLTTDSIAGEVIWKSSIPYIGNVDTSGRFFALAEGTTIITAASVLDPGMKVQVQIQVSALDVPVLQIELDSHRIFTVSKDAIQLEVSTVKPLEAMNRSLTWMSSDERVASVTQNGQVTIHKDGTAVIRVESTVNLDVYDECMIVILPEGNMLAGLGDKVKVSGEQPDSLGKYAIDGNMNSRWSDSNKDAYWFQADLGMEKEIGRYLIVNAGPFESWLGSKINTHALQIQTSSDGHNWVL
jgi:hypothetical protein